MARAAESLFDVEGFINDVLQYMGRHKMTYSLVGHKLGINDNNIRRTLKRREAEPSLWMACALARLCDLSLDDYRVK